MTVGKNSSRRSERGKSRFENEPDRESLLKELPVAWETDDGFASRLSPKSRWNIISLDCWADPRKTSAWALEMMGTIGMQRFQREFLRNWTLSTQSPFFPEYTTRGGDRTFVRSFTSVGSSDLLLGLDFGFRRPAVVAGQVNERKTRAYVLREWMPQNISALAFMEVVEWLVGELPEQEVGPEGLRHILDLRRRYEEKKGPAVPWWKHPPGRVLRYTGSEAYRTSQEVMNEAEDKRVADIWNNRGFPLQIHHAQVKSGELVIRHLLRHQPKKVDPFFLIDESCEILREGFNGGYTLKRPTRLDPAPDQPAKDGYYEHLFDGLRYLLLSAIDPRRVDSGEADDGKEPERVRVIKENRKDKGYYSRAEVSEEERDDAFSSPFAHRREGSGRRDIYERED